MSFHFKQKAHDFFVSENLPFELKGKGDAFYVQIEKRNLTTHDVIHHLRKSFGISRMTLGIAGLKDKKAVARQWISIYKRALSKLGGVKVFLKALEEIVVVKETGRHPTPLNLSTPITNSFRIKFRATEQLSQEDKKAAKKAVKQIVGSGYPNLFGDQRFGIDGRNATQGREIVMGVSREKMSKTDTIFKIQAYASQFFNEYTKARIEQGKMLMDGDIVSRVIKGVTQHGMLDLEKKVVNHCEVKGTEGKFFFTPAKGEETTPYDEKNMIVTGPVLGFNLALPNPESEAGKFEQAFLKSQDGTADRLKKFEDMSIYGLRREIRVEPTDTSVKFKKGDVIVEFTLPSGAYASIVFDKLTEALE